jgi:phosphate transport system permease protein
VIIAIMIVPIITSISREVFRAVPDSQREAAFALGATRWEVTRLAVLKGSMRGIFGAAMLGLGRALGETMAVTMVIGNSTDFRVAFRARLHAGQRHRQSNFPRRLMTLYRSALFELGLVLLLVTIVTNILAHLLVGAVGAPKHAGHA